MSRYTTRIRYICEEKAGLEESVGYDDIGQVLHASCNTVMPWYPIFDEAYREVLNTKILKHYYTREICEETYGLWKLRMDARMNEIMPYYNKLYIDRVNEYNPLYDVDIKTERTKDSNGVSSFESKNKVSDERNNENVSTNNGISKRVGETKSESENVNVGSTLSESNSDKGQVRQYSDTPQGGLDNLSGSTVYLTNLTKDDGNETVKNKGNTVTNENNKVEFNDDTTVKDSSVSVGSGSSSGSVDGKRNDSSVVASTEDYIERVSGRNGGESYAKLLLEFKDNILNIDKMIIDELKDLFFGLYN